MYPKQIATETAKVLQSYLTYQAVKTIIAQLSETNPSMALWLTEYSSGNKMQDGEAYIEGLMLEHKDLVMRILAVRRDLAEQILDFLPDMVRQNLEQSSLNNRRQLLERLTQSLPSDCDTFPDHNYPESD
ncbi:MAG: RbcX chaperonin protein [Gloeocapsa sp. DLM2.Bin57]|nr:MAG: RbcX chaperonin protein [Gloeocapsa sp. DLM2.Bin57]